MACQRSFCRGERCERIGTRTSRACQSFLQGCQVRVPTPRNSAEARFALLTNPLVDRLRRNHDAPIWRLWLHECQVWVLAPRWFVRISCRGARYEWVGTRTSRVCRELSARVRDASRHTPTPRWPVNSSCSRHQSPHGQGLQAQLLHKPYAKKTASG